MSGKRDSNNASGSLRRIGELHRRHLVYGLYYLTLIVLAVGGAWWYTHRDRRAISVSEDAFTIYLLGSSTAYGFPFDTQIDLGKLVSALLGGQMGGHPIAVVNLALPGRVAREVLQDAQKLIELSPAPDRGLVFVYPANNEYARLDRRPDVTWKERTLFDTPVVSPEEQAQIESNYGGYLAETFRVLREAGFAVLASTAVVNMKDWDPNRSVLGDSSHSAPIRAELTAGQQALESGDPGSALGHFEAILSVEPRFALASKRAGDCCLALGRTIDARKHFQRAIDDDGYPLRDTSRLDLMLRRACDQEGIPLLETGAILSSESANGITGFDLLWDNCHPTFEGYVLIARAIAKQVGSWHNSAPIALSDAALRRAVGYDTVVEQTALNREGQYCYTASTLIFDPRPRLARARYYLERADALGPDPNVVCSLAILAGLEGNLEESLGQWRRAMQLNSEVTHERINNKYVAQIMRNLGVEDLAQALE